MTTLFHFAAPVNVENFGIGVFPTPTPAPVETCPRGFRDVAGRYVPSVEEESWLLNDTLRLEGEAEDAHLEAMAWEAIMADRVSGQLTDEDILIATGCVG